jgi:hypothetical protein
MITLELTPEELKVLEETLERSASDLAMEIGHTDSHDFKERLKARKAALDHLLHKIQGHAIPV